MAIHIDRRKRVIVLRLFIILTILITASRSNSPAQSHSLPAGGRASTPIFLPLITKKESPRSIPGSDMALIPAGNFQMGCQYGHSGPCFSSELPLHTVYLSAYSIDRTEVSNYQYAACVADHGCTPPNSYSSATRQSYFNNPAYLDYPVTYVTWNQAQAFCQWRSKLWPASPATRLPTEAEWERAARGAGDARDYPWGDSSPSCSLANYTFWNGYPSQRCISDTVAVGSYLSGASPEGVLDMAGNVME